MEQCLLIHRDKKRVIYKGEREDNSQTIHRGRVTEVEGDSLGEHQSGGGQNGRRINMTSS